ncbi:hypothetical protein NMY22_g19136 [Coprinellus aureogranulatus]|nr:hypothetical protein NMY22_g19136 [Coprinellus aureogranulatus]
MSACPLPFQSLAATNACPTAHEVAVVQHQIDNLELKRPALLRLLAQAQSLLHNLDTEIDTLKPILAPVRRLPLEIIGEIFLMVSPNPKTRPGNYQRALTSLILVCKSWRDAAYLTPRLWCDIRVKMDTPSLSFDSLGQWIRRAGKVPKVLEISLSNCGGVNYGTGAYICAGSRCLFSDPILATLLTQSVGTWFSVTLNCPTSICLRNFALTLINATKQPGSRWDCVRSFTVVANSWPRWMTDRHRRIPSDFSFIPTSVTDLDLQLPSTPPGTHANSAWRLPLQIPPAVLDSLSTLKLVFGHDEIVVSSIFLALQHCERLEKLMIDFTTGTAELLEGMPDGMEYDGWSRMEASGVHLPRLQSLQLSGLGGVTVESSCWYILKMPRLVAVAR